MLERIDGVADWVVGVECDDVGDVARLVDVGVVEEVTYVVVISETSTSTEQVINS